MKINKLILALSLSLSITNGAQAQSVQELSHNKNMTEKIFVVERESSSLAVIENGLPSSHIKGMHNMNHGVVKFYENQNKQNVKIPSTD